MEFFNRAKVVRLKGHLGKYLVADDDEHSVRQSRNGSSRKARWTVEMVVDNPHLIRLKSCHDKYLSASDDAFLLGMTGKRVLQALPNYVTDGTIDWEPIKEGYQVKLRTRGGKFLRANGATPPWRNSVTHDLPNRTATQDWVLWDVDVVDISAVLDNESLQSYPSSLSSFSSFGDNDCNTDYSSTPRSVSFNPSCPSIASDRSSHASSRQNGMEFFERAKEIRLQSHLGKYLVADEDEQTVRQSRNGSSQRARWIVELVEGKSHVIRLKSCYGLYLTATDQSFLLGMTGKKVLQTMSTKTLMDASIEWEPIKEGLYVKLRTNEGKYLRANGATPPWRNSITHDVPNRTATQDWILWGVDVVDITIMDPVSSSCLSPASSFNSVLDDYMDSPDTGSPSAIAYQYSQKSKNVSMKQSSGMEFFKKAKSVRLKSHHDKFLIADADQETVYQDRTGSSNSATWTVEFPEGTKNVIRLKSCYDKYLTATDDHVRLGVTGRKVVQSLPRKLDSSVEWEPMKDGSLLKLKTRYGNYLRANSGLPPWRNSITHDIPHRHQDWILWEVDIIEILPESTENITRSDSLDDDDFSSSFHLTSTTASSRSESIDNAFDSPTVRSQGRLIYYHVADENGNANDAVEGPCFHFKGHGVEELTQKLEEVTGLESITVCSRNKFNGNLYPLRLALPPNNATMHVVVVPVSSKS